MNAASHADGDDDVEFAGVKGAEVMRSRLKIRHAKGRCSPRSCSCLAVAMPGAARAEVRCRETGMGLLNGI